MQPGEREMALHLKFKNIKLIQHPRLFQAVPYLFLLELPFLLSAITRGVE
jgi:hypothetical protein